MSANSIHSDLDIDFLHEISSRMAAADPLHEVLARVVEFASEVVKCDSCFIYVLEQDELVLRASMNPHDEVVDRLKIRVGQGITGWLPSIASPWPFPSTLPKIRASRFSTNCPKIASRHFCRCRFCVAGAWWV